jgi:hypothetical protein
MKILSQLHFLKFIRALSVSLVLPGISSKVLINDSYTFFSTCMTSIAWCTIKSIQYGRFKNIDLFLNNPEVSLPLFSAFFSTFFLVFFIFLLSPPFPFPRNNFHILDHPKHMLPLVNLWGTAFLNCPIKSFLIFLVRLICSKKSTMSHVHYFLKMLQPYTTSFIHAPGASFIAFKCLSRNTTKSRPILYCYEQHCS